MKRDSDTPPAHSAEEADIAFGWDLAKEMGRLDVGQSVAVRERAVLAVEAIEGTDQAIALRAALCPRGGFVVVKVAKPQQDMRFDVPTSAARPSNRCSKAGGPVWPLKPARPSSSTRRDHRLGRPLRHHDRGRRGHGDGKGRVTAIPAGRLPYLRVYNAADSVTSSADDCATHGHDDFQPPERSARDWPWRNGPAPALVGGYGKICPRRRRSFAAPANCGSSATWTKRLFGRALGRGWRRPAHGLEAGTLIERPTPYQFGVEPARQGQPTSRSGGSIGRLSACRSRAKLDAQIRLAGLNYRPGSHESLALGSRRRRSCRVGNGLQSGH